MRCWCSWQHLLQRLPQRCWTLLRRREKKKKPRPVSDCGGTEWKEPGLACERTGREQGDEESNDNREGVGRGWLMVDDARSQRARAVEQVEPEEKTGRIARKWSRQRDGRTDAPRHTTSARRLGSRGRWCCWCCWLLVLVLVLLELVLVLGGGGSKEGGEGREGEAGQELVCRGQAGARLVDFVGSQKGWRGSQPQVERADREKTSSEADKSMSIRCADSDSELKHYRQGV